MSGLKDESSRPPRVLEIAYDGECPFCSRYVALLRLRARFDEVRLIDLRSEPERVARYREQGLDPDAGMVVELDGTCHHGADAVAILAALGGEDDLWNRLHRRVFATPSRARRLYPLLRAGRDLTLRLLGRHRL